ncbi:unnamed protein product [Citrullus colocynthis]|uniref:C2H2-type domain-containing protein n=1 Tax=Citrullus colocynthis TaxID=252529 RepID=A0ABP0Y450_9ROSI
MAFDRAMPALMTFEASTMDDKSVPYNLRLRRDHKASSPTEHSKTHKQDKDFQEKAIEEVYAGHLVVNYRCENCGCSFDLETSLRSHHCKFCIFNFNIYKYLQQNKSEKEAIMEIGVEKNLGENKSFRRRSRKGIPTRAPFF